MQVLVGLVGRDQLSVVLRRVLVRGSARGLPLLSYQDLNRQYVSAAARTLLAEQQLQLLQVDALGSSFKTLKDPERP